MSKTLHILYSIYCLLPFKVRSFFNKLFEKLGTHPVWHLEILKHAGYRPASVIDVGAYQGEWSSLVRPIFSEARFLLVEAQEKKRPFMEALRQKIPNLSYEIALLGAVEKAQVPFFEMETGSSVYEEQTDIPRQVSLLPMKTLNGLIETYQLQGPIFLKLDVQGAELDVLEGAKAHFDKIDFILLETSLLQYNLNAPLLHQVIAQMAEWDYFLFDWCGVHRRADTQILFQIDLLFAHKTNPIRQKADLFK